MAVIEKPRNKIKIYSILGTAGSGKTTALIDLLNYLIQNTDKKKLRELKETYPALKQATNVELKYAEVWSENFSHLDITNVAFSSFSNIAIKEIAERSGLTIKGRQGELTRYWRTTTGLFEVLLYEDNLITREQMKKIGKIELYRKLWAKKNGLQYIINEVNTGFSRGRGNEIINEYSYLVHYHYGKNKTLEDIIDMHSNKKLIIDYLAFKKKHKFLDWEDIVMKAYKNNDYLAMNDEIELFILDEAQDTSNLEYKTLLPILSNTQADLLIAGDDAQLIYSFKGADYKLFNYLIKKSKEKNGIIMNLNYTHRFGRRIGRLAQVIMDGMLFVEHRKMLTSDSKKDKVIYIVDFNKVIEFLKREDVKRQKVFILTRTNLVSDKVLELLKQHGIIVYNKDEEKNRLMTKEYEVYIDLKKWFAGELNDYEKRQLKLLIWKHRKSMTELEKLLAMKQLDEMFEQQALTIEGLTRLLKWMEENINPDKLDLNLIKQFIMTDKEKHNLFNNIYVGTIHSVKGAEADIVILINTISSATARKIKDWEAEKRVLFVAVTRAKKLLILTHINKQYNAKNRVAVSWMDVLKYLNFA